MTSFLSDSCILTVTRVEPGSAPNLRCLSSWGSNEVQLRAHDWLATQFV